MDVSNFACNNVNSSLTLSLLWHFVIENSYYSYSKQENFTIGDPEMLQFTHLLMEAKSKYSPNIKPYLKTHDIIDYIDGFSHITLNHNMLPPIKIKTKPSIFIMKRKPNIKYDPNKARSRSSIKNFENQEDDTKNVKLNTLLEEEVINKYVESMEELEKTKETIEQNFSDIKLETKEGNNAMEKKEVFNDLADGNINSVDSTTWETESINELSIKLRNKNKENINFQEDFEDVSDINDVKSDKKTQIEEENIIKKPKNDINHHEIQGFKETVKKIIQEKMLEARQRREANDDRKNVELPMKPMKKKGVTAEMLKRIGELKQELKELPIIIDKSAIMEEESNIMKENMKDDEFSKQKPVTQKKDKIKLIELDNLEQIEDIMEEENKIVDLKVEMKKSQDKINAELPEVEKEENVKVPKLINVRESIRNIINQFKEFEKDFIHDDTNLMASTNDINHIESDSHIMKMHHSAENNGKLMVKDARESLKEIIDQFKYIKHELTLEEDDQFDEIAAKYMEQPIAETLLQFSEALKALIQRRKKASLKEHVANLYDNKDTSENQRKSIAEEINVNSNNINIREKESSQKNAKNRVS